MEITMKQKLIVTGLMALVFAGGILLKYHFQQQESILLEAAGSSGEENGENMGQGTQTPLEEELTVIVDVEGAVQNPGIVRLAEGSRVYQAIEQAGGVLENADTKYINQAEEVTDGVIIYIPFLEGSGQVEKQGEGENDPSGENSSVSHQQGSQADGEMESSGPINLNKANLETLMTLPGIGESYAAAIIDYREQNGFFQSVEELKEIEGIGEKKFEKLKDLVSVY